MTVNHAGQPSMTSEALETFVQMADTLVADFDLIDTLTVLAARCVELLDVEAVGILLADGDGRLRVMAASNEKAELLELFQLQSDEGPCLDCYTDGEAVINSDLCAATPWPRFAAESVRLGFRSVCALPMRLRSDVLGCVNLFISAPVRLSDAQMAVGQALADLSSIAIVQDASSHFATTRLLRLEQLLNSRVIIEQAKGMIAEHASVEMDAAFARIRTFARAHGLGLTETALSLVEGRRTLEMFGEPLGLRP
jgi:GAF domain-containing protein